MHLAAFLITIAGLATLTASLSTRPLPDPTCAACKHSLAGLEPKTDTTIRCPECGTQLLLKRRIRLEKPVFRPLLATLGFGLAAAGLAWSFWLAFA